MSLVTNVPVGTTPVNLITTRPGTRVVKVSARNSAVDLYFATQASQLPLTTSNGTHVVAGTTTSVNMTPGVASLAPFTVQAVAATTGAFAGCRMIPF